MNVRLPVRDLSGHGSNNFLLTEEPVARDDSALQGLSSVVMTGGLKRLFTLVARCVQNQEPILLVGETGGGKTTVCQLLCYAMGLKFYSLSCHAHTDVSDIIGGWRPLRDRDER